MSRRLLLFVLLANLQTIAFAENEQQLVGVNLSGAEYGSAALPGKNGFNYLWPTTEEIKRFGANGFNVVRIPFLWERMQSELKMPLDENQAHYLDAIIQTAFSVNVKIIIDPHNFGAYRGVLIGSKNVTAEDFQDFWLRMAERYKKYPNVIFGLMNEPNKQSALEWAVIAQAGVDGIRKAGAKQLILVPGTYWTGAHSWLKKYNNNSSNAEALVGINDPENNFAYEMHNYFDADSSGTNLSCVSADIGVQRLQSATAWLINNGRKAFFGEFGAPDNEVCLKAISNTLDYLKENKSVWLGWAYWSASKWGGNYKYDIYSLNPEQQKQFAILKPYLINSTD